MERSTENFSMPHNVCDGKTVGQSASSLYKTLEEQELEAQKILDRFNDKDLQSLIEEYSNLGFLPTEILEEVKAQQEINTLEDLELKNSAEKFLDAFIPPTTALRMAKELQDCQH